MAKEFEGLKAEFQYNYRSSLLNDPTSSSESKQILHIQSTK